MSGEWLEFAEDVFHAVVLVAAAGGIGLFVFEAGAMILDMA